MDWPLPFSSAWNAATIHVLAQRFWDLHKDTALKDTNVALGDIKAICECKLERTRREYNAAQNAFDMDTGERDKIGSARAAASRRYTRRLGVSHSVNVGWQNVD
jgi:hypothetical protein